MMLKHALFTDSPNPRGSIFIIAEAGVNHNGDVTLAKQLIDAAASSGADAVKFQTFNPEELATNAAQKAEYQKNSTGNDGSQLAMLQQLALSNEEFSALKIYAEQKNILFLSTPFDVQSLHFLVDDLDLPIIKIGSGDLTNALLLHKAVQAGKPIILSTGMANLDEIDAAMKQLADSEVILLHCLTEYPAPIDELNLSAIESLCARYDVPVGYSDHSMGITVPIAAAALGARVIEKHITLDKTMAGPDHKASLSPDEFTQMVAAIRDVEQALGDGQKRCMPSEAKNRPIARRSIVAAKAIAKGELFSEKNITVKRPEGGLSPTNYFTLIGTPATKDYAKDEPIAASQEGA